MISVVVLICSLAVSPADCNEKSAAAIVRGEVVSTPGGCGQEAQAALARSAFKPDFDHEYLRQECRRAR